LIIFEPGVKLIQCYTAVVTSCTTTAVSSFWAFGFWFFANIFSIRQWWRNLACNKMRFIVLLDLVTN